MCNSCYHNHNQQQQIINSYIQSQNAQSASMKKTIMHQQSMKLKPIQQREFPLLRRKQQNNSKPMNSADIEYLLEFVDTNEQEAQQLRMQNNSIRSSSSNKQQQQQQQSEKRKDQSSNSILNTSTITTYIVENNITTNKQGDTPQQRSNLISFIDLGLKIIGKVRKLMVRKKSQIKVQQQKQSSLIKDLFFPQGSSNLMSTQQKVVNNHSVSNGNTIRQQTKMLITTNSLSSSSLQPQQMRLFRLQCQKHTLLHKLSTHGNPTNINTNTSRYKYMLTASLYEQLVQKRSGEKDIQCDTGKLIDGLEGKLERLDVFHQRRQQRSSQQIMINQIWAIIEQVSTAIKVSNSNIKINNTININININNNT